MPAAEAFIDTGVLVYLLSSEGDKADRAEQLLLRPCVVSVQVLNELASVALRKRALSLTELRAFLSGIREFCRVVPLTLDAHEQGVEIAERYRFALYDSMIIASALESGCRVLYSEDLQHGQVIERSLKVINPFAA